MEIKEVGKKLNKTFEKNGSMIAVAIGLLLVVYLIISGNNTTNSDDSGELVNAVAYASYPDAVTNANVIMGEVNNHTTNEINNLQDNLEERFDNVDESNQGILEKIDTSTSSITEKIDTNTDSIIKSNTDNTSSIISTVNSNTNKVQTEIKNSTNNINNTVKSYQTSQSGKTSSSKKSTASFYKKTSVSNGSIVDALKKIGVNSSFSNRKKIAKANNIKNYTGSSSQNTKLVNLLKQGKLKKA